MALFELTEAQLIPMASTTFDALGLRERADLQRLLRTQIDVVAPETMVLAEEFGEWEESRRSIDLLLLDKNADLIVCELKRTEDGGHMELQAIRYAAMVSSMTFVQAVEAHRQFLQQLGIEADAHERVLHFLGWDKPREEEFAKEVRILLVSANFSREITSSVLWLNERGLDIRCVRLIPHSHATKCFLDVQQLIPLPEAQEYQIKVREKAQEERISRDNRMADLYRRFWIKLLEKAKVRMALHRGVSPSATNWLSAQRNGLKYAYVLGWDSPRVELYIDRGDAVKNKVIFDELQSHKDQIERAFGAPLDWQPLEAAKACRIAVQISEGSIHQEGSWEVLQETMVDCMERLEKVLEPFVRDYVSGLK